MFDRWWRLTLVAGLLSWTSASVRAQDAGYPPRDEPPQAEDSFRPNALLQDALRGPDEPLSFEADRPREADPRMAPQGPAAGFAAPAERPAGAPPAGARGAAPEGPVDGTWREEGRYVIINVDGRQMRLLKDPSARDPADAAGQRAPSPTEGTVRGRLLQRKHPLVDCQVVLVPMHKADGVACYDNSRQLLCALTDCEGVYNFENVPAGDYKMTWLPKGTRQWIRRIAMKPDVHVHGGENVTLRDIRMATQTIN